MVLLLKVIFYSCRWT